MPWVLPFQLPCTPPDPPSIAFSGSPTRMLMFCSGFVPNRMLTWQYDGVAPAAGTIWLVADLTSGLPNRPLSGSVAGSPQLTGAGGCECFLLSADAGAASTQRTGTRENKTGFRMVPPGL